MQDEKQYNNIQSQFDELIKQKMDHFSAPIDDADWQKIEARIGKKGNGGARWMWISVASIAASVALLIMLNVLFKGNENENLLTQESRTEEKTNVNNLAEEQTGTANIADNGNLNKNTIVQKAISPCEDPTTENISNLYNSSLTANNNTTLSENKDSNTIAQNNDELEKELPTKRKENKQIITTLEPKTRIEEIPLPTKKEKNKWHLMLAYGTSNGKSQLDATQQSAMSDLSLRKTESFMNSAYTDEAIDETNYTDIRFSPPVSVGLHIKKNINNSLGIQTGIRYTYLATQLKEESRFSRVTDMQLHYLGIPLNLVYTIFNSSKWDIYFSGGIIAEKGLMQYKQESQTYDNTLATSDPSSIIDGIQWSTNLAFGVNYFIYKNLGLYLEPNVSYYFDNNQPVSIRTKQPLTINLNLGLMYNF